MRSAEWSVVLVVGALAIVGDLWRGQRPPAPAAAPVVELDEELPDVLLAGEEVGEAGEAGEEGGEPPAREAPAD